MSTCPKKECYSHNTGVLSLLSHCTRTYTGSLYFRTLLCCLYRRLSTLFSSPVSTPLCHSCSWNSTGLLLCSLREAQCHGHWAPRTQPRGPIWHLWQEVQPQDSPHDCHPTGGYMYVHTYVRTYMYIHVMSWKGLTTSWSFYHPVPIIFLIPLLFCVYSTW